MAGTEADVIPPDSVCIVKTITLSGNKITKDRIIFRELEFKTGDTLYVNVLDSLIVQSRQNLMNRSLFNFVTITKKCDHHNMYVEVDVVERWYIWPIPIVQFADRNINSWWERRSWKRVNYGMDLKIENFRGLMERLNVTIQGGYDVLFGLKWEIPYLDKKQRFGMKFETSVKLNHEISYITEDNKPMYFNSDEGFSQKKYYGNIEATYRPGFHTLHSFSVEYDNFSFIDTIQKLNPQFAYGPDSYQYFGINYTFKLDFRDYNPYPLTGYYFDFGIQKAGLGIFNSGINILSFTTNFDQYIHLYKRWYFAYNLGGKLSSRGNPPPYFYKSGVGYSPFTIRGYELYVVDGLNLGVFKSNIKFEIMPQKDYNIKWIRTPKFSKIFFAMYANLFFDAAYVKNNYSDFNNPYDNEFIWGTGVGIDLVTYYDIVVRFEGSVNRQLQKGFYISFVAPI